MNDNSDSTLDALFSAARSEGRVHQNTTAERLELGFETRVMARLREERTLVAAVSAWAWRLCPFFAALALAVGWWTQALNVRVQADATALVEASRSGQEQLLLAFMTGDRRD